MKINSFLYIIIAGVISLFSSCEKDEKKVYLSSNPGTPTIATLPDLTLNIDNRTDTLIFKGTPVDPGFRASVNYYLEADTAGNDFKNAVTLSTGTQDTLFKITEGTLNNTLITRFPTDLTSTVEFRIRSVLVTDAGTGATPVTILSPTKSVNVATYGLPRLDLVSTTASGKIQSALLNSVYTSFIKFAAGASFTLKDPKTNVVYGISGNKLGANGTAFTANTAGWYYLTANLNDMSYTFAPCIMGIIGAGTPTGWDSDTKMDFDAKTQSWFITIDLTAADIKFRANGIWDGIFNLGWGPDKSNSNLVNSTSSGNITVSTAGKYLVRLYINDRPYKVTLTKL